MNVYYNLNELTAPLPNPVVTLGNFDGVHRGHREIFKALKQEAAACQGTAAVITFNPHPLTLLRPDAAPPIITPIEWRLQLIGGCGIEHVFCLPFTREFAGLSPDDFATATLVDKLHARQIWVGEDFRFGKGRQGNVAYLKKLGEQHGFSVHRVKTVQARGAEVSSTRIRQSLSEGNVVEAAALLGRAYSIEGEVIAGEKRGRTLGFPTANIRTEAKIIPPNGVYAAWTILDGIPRMGIANLGVKPTFSGSRHSIEVFIFDFDQDIYGQTLRLFFVDRIRDEIAFPGPEALVAQIRADIGKAEQVFRDLSRGDSLPPLEANAREIP